MENADPTFLNIQELLKTAIFLKQQIKYEESRRFVNIFVFLSVSVITRERTISYPL